MVNFRELVKYFWELIRSIFGNSSDLFLGTIFKPFSNCRDLNLVNPMSVKVFTSLRRFRYNFKGNASDWILL